MIFFFTYVLLFSVPICWPLFTSNYSSFIIPPIFISNYLASHPVSLFTFFLLSLVSNPFFPLILSFLLFSLSPTLDLFCFWLSLLTFLSYPSSSLPVSLASLSMFLLFSLSLQYQAILSLCLSLSISLSVSLLPLPPSAWLHTQPRPLVALRSALWISSP